MGQNFRSLVPKPIKKCWAGWCRVKVESQIVPDLALREPTDYMGPDHGTQGSGKSSGKGSLVLWGPRKGAQRTQ